MLITAQEQITKLRDTAAFSNLASGIKACVQLSEKYIVMWIRKVLNDETVRTTWYSGKTMYAYKTKGSSKSQISSSKYIVTSLMLVLNLYACMKS